VEIATANLLIFLSVCRFQTKLQATVLSTKKHYTTFFRSVEGRCRWGKNQKSLFNLDTGNMRAKV